MRSFAARVPNSAGKAIEATPSISASLRARRAASSSSDWLMMSEVGLSLGRVEPQQHVAGPHGLTLAHEELADHAAVRRLDLLDAGVDDEPTWRDDRAREPRLGGPPAEPSDEQRADEQARRDQTADRTPRIERTIRTLAAHGRPAIVVRFIIDDSTSLIDTPSLGSNDLQRRRGTRQNSLEDLVPWSESMGSALRHHQH